MQIPNHRGPGTICAVLAASVPAGRIEAERVDVSNGLHFCSVAMLNGREDVLHGDGKVLHAGEGTLHGRGDALRPSAPRGPARA
jgi:hypothetical protein